MSLPLPNPRHTLSEPKPDIREANDDDDQDSNSFQLQQDRAWLREQLLAGKNWPLCDPLPPPILPKVTGSRQRRVLK